LSSITLSLVSRISNARSLILDLSKNRLIHLSSCPLK
jgi:hypothetical protein